jgi:hypothetical protein
MDQDEIDYHADMEYDRLRDEEREHAASGNCDHCRWRPATNAGYCAGCYAYLEEEES